MKVRQAYQQMSNFQFGGKKNFTFEQYVTQHQQAHNVIDSTRNVETMMQARQIDCFLEGIKASYWQALVEFLKASTPNSLQLPERWKSTIIRSSLQLSTQKTVGTRLLVSKKAKAKISRRANLVRRAARVHTTQAAPRRNTRQTTIRPTPNGKLSPRSNAMPSLSNARRLKPRDRPLQLHEWGPIMTSF